MNTSVIKDIYATLSNVNVNIICDPKDAMTNSTHGVLLEIQSCWIRNEDNSATAYNCPNATDQIFTQPCPDFTIIR